MTEPTAPDLNVARTAGNWRRVCGVYDRFTPQRWSKSPSVDAWEPFALACLSRCRGLVESIALLREREADAATLVRVLFEHVVTFAWLMVNPSEHQRQFLRWEIAQRAKIFADMRAHGLLASEDEAAILEDSVRLEAAAASKAAPEVPDRALAADRYWQSRDSGRKYELRSMYGWVWRSFSAHVHPTWSGLVWQIAENGESLQIEARALDPDEPLCLAVVLFADALRVSSLALGWPPLQDIDDAYLADER